MEKFICIHGHFYQPPRENPWLESVELQDSAAPYHDWNERVTAECYAPNAHARLVDGRGRIERIVNNYAKISFDFGPTLLSWMKEKAADIHQPSWRLTRRAGSGFPGTARRWRNVTTTSSCRWPAASALSMARSGRMSTADWWTLPCLAWLNARGNEQARIWVERFLGFGDKLGFGEAAKQP